MDRLDRVLRCLVRIGFDHHIRIRLTGQVSLGSIETYATLRWGRSGRYEIPRLDQTIDHWRRYVLQYIDYQLTPQYD